MVKATTAQGTSDLQSLEEFVSLIRSKWPLEISQLRLPRPTVLKIKILNAGPIESDLLSGYQNASNLLKTLSVHQIERWEVVARYAKNFGEYSHALATYTAMADSLFLNDMGKISEQEREHHLARLLDDPNTVSYGLAGSLCFATHIAALATAFAAFAVNNPSKRSYIDARNATQAADRYLFEFERLETRYT